MRTETTKTPLAETLDLTRGMKVWFADVPDAVCALIAPKQAGMEVLAAPSDGMDAAILFVESQDDARRELADVAQLLAPAGFAWLFRATHGDGEVTDDLAAEADLLMDGMVTIGDEWTGIRFLRQR